MKFGKIKPCNVVGSMGEPFVSLIEVIGGKRYNTIGLIYFTKSGKPRYVDASDTSYDYTPGDLRTILERMKIKTDQPKNNYE